MEARRAAGEREREENEKLFRLIIFLDDVKHLRTRLSAEREKVHDTESLN
jgi:hypothetical protein